MESEAKVCYNRTDHLLLILGDRMPEVIALGDVNVDVIAHFPTFPTPGEDAFASASTLHCGGSAANTAVGLARMGIDTALLACVGCDPWASAALDILERAGVRLDGVQRQPGAMTGLMYVIVTPDGERTILGDRGANAYTDPMQIGAAALAGAGLLHLSGYALLTEPQRSAALRALALAREQGLLVSLDPGLNLPDLGSSLIPSLLSQVDILLPSLAEAQKLTGLATPEACARALVEGGVGCVALKLGRQGCLLGRGQELDLVPGLAIRVRDTTGAGDAFAAGFLAAVLRGLDRHSAALLANAMGALTATRVGGGAALPSPAETLAFLKRQDREGWPGRGHEPLERAHQFVEMLADRKERGLP
jgi:ribokinase